MKMTILPPDFLTPETIRLLNLLNIYNTDHSKRFYNGVLGYIVNDEYRPEFLLKVDDPN